MNFFCSVEQATAWASMVTRAGRLVTLDEVAAKAGALFPVGAASIRRASGPPRRGRPGRE